MNQEKGLSSILSVKEYREQGLDFGDPVCRLNKNDITITSEDAVEFAKEGAEANGCNAAVYYISSTMYGFTDTLEVSCYKTD